MYLGENSSPYRDVAQSVEHRTFNPLVVGSIPTVPTKYGLVAQLDRATVF